MSGRGSRRMVVLAVALGLVAVTACTDEDARSDPSRGSSAASVLIDAGTGGSGPAATGAPANRNAAAPVNADPLGLREPALPAITAVAGDESAIAPGYTMFNMLHVPPIQGSKWGTLVVVDPYGRIVWQYSSPGDILDARLLDDGTILYTYEDREIHQIDVDGNLLRRWTSRKAFPETLAKMGAPGTSTIEVATDSFHHEAYFLPNGNMITLSTALHERAEPEPRCGEDPEKYDGTMRLISDVIVEFDPDTGEIVREVDLFDLFDPFSNPEEWKICGTPNVTAVPVPLYSEGGRYALVDWSHGNAIELDEERNALLVSLRHQDATIALRYEDDAAGAANEVMWMLRPGAIEATDGGVLPSHQHAPEVEDDGSVLFYDNGLAREQSRAVSYELDLDAGTVAQRWQFESEVDGTPAYAAAVGDVDRLDNGNVLITNGFYLGNYGNLAAQIVEVVPNETGDGGEVVSEIRVDNGDGGDDAGDWVVYRAQRVPVDVFGP